MLKLYNTLTRSFEEFVPIKKGKVTFYHCGPTVYWTQHIGNLRGMTMGDLIVRTLRYLDYDVTYVRNYTDVGHLTSDADTGVDKMEKGAVREGKTPAEIAQKYIDIFEKDVSAVNLLEPNFKPRPSLLIPEILAMVQTLMDHGYAYQTDLAVYFDVSKFSNYSRLSRQKMEKNIAGAGTADTEDPKKKHFADFALWVLKAGKHANALQTWPSSFGVGFPGWHIECSVMAKKYLGETIDIHLGGVEHIPVHHTNEIAQSEAANGVPFVHYFLHNEHLIINNEKMAKSQGTGFSLQEVVDHGFDPIALRYFFLQAHYRSRQNFTWESLTASVKGLVELKKEVGEIKAGTTEIPGIVVNKQKISGIEQYKNDFQKALENDFNVPQALAITWELLKSDLPDIEKYALIMDFDKVLGLKLDSVTGDNKHLTEEIPSEIKQLIAKRDRLRKEKKFSEADEVRRQIEEAGYNVEDTPTGVNLKK